MKNLKLLRPLAWLLAVCMVIGMMPVSALASETDTGDSAAVTDPIPTAPTPEQAVAKIEATEYTDLQAAIDAAESGAVITLLCDVALKGGLEVAKDDQLTLDLAGHTLSYASDEAKASAAITNRGDLTVTGNGKISYHSSQPSTAYSYATNTITNCGKLTVVNGAVENTTNGGVSYAVDNNSSGSAAILVVNGGSLTGNGTAIRQFANGQPNHVTVTGGTVKGVTGGVFVQHVSNSDTDLTVSGGTVEATAPSYGTVFVNPWACKGGTVDVAVSGDAKVIAGDGKNAVHLYFEGANIAVDADVMISGGTFTGAFQVTHDTSGTPAITGKGISVSGGTFTAKPSEYLAAGYAVTQNGDSWSVAKREATGNETVVGDLVLGADDSLQDAVSEAIANAGTGETPVKVEVPKSSTTSATVTDAVTAIAGAASGNASAKVELVIPVTPASNESGTVKLDVAVVKAVVGTDPADLAVVLNVEKQESFTADTTVTAGSAVYDITLKKGETTVTDLGGTATITLPLPEIPAGQKLMGVKVYYRADSNAEWTLLEESNTVTYNEENLTFTTTHFTEFAAVPQTEDAGWSDLADTSWYNGTDTEFTITTAEQLAGLAQLVNAGNSFSGKTVKLGADIDLANKEWTPIGLSSARFCGTFDGNNQIISNLCLNYTDSTQGIALFGNVGDSTTVTSGTVKNIKLENANVTGGSFSVAAVCARLRYGAVENCDVFGTVTITGGAGTGVIVGISTVPGEKTNAIKDCDVSGTVMLHSVQGWAGGIVGQATRTVIDNCSVIGTEAAPIIMTIGEDAGSIGGVMGNDAEGVVIKNTRVDHVKLTGERVGGIAGLSNAITVMNCSANNLVLTPKTDMNLIGSIVGANNVASGQVTKLYNNTSNSSLAHMPVYTTGGEENKRAFVGTGVTLDENNKVLTGEFTVIDEATAGAVLAETAIVTDNGDGTWTVKAAVASVTLGSEVRYYATLGEALADAANGSTVTLLKNTEEGAVTVSPKPVSAVEASEADATYSITLDLAGFTVSYDPAGSSAKAAADALITIEEGATVTITGNGTISGCISDPDSSNGICALNNAGTLTIESGTYKGRLRAVHNAAGGTITIQGGIFTGGNYGLYIVGADSEVTIQDGTFTGSVNAVYHGNGTLTIHGGSFGYSITTNEKKSQNGVQTVNGKAKLTINGGSFTGSENGLLVENGENVITGGTVTGKVSVTGGSLAISGGTFSEAVQEEYCAEGFVPIANANDTYGVAAKITGSTTAKVVKEHDGLHDSVIFGDFVPEGNVKYSSFYVELYAGETKLATSTIQNIDHWLDTYEGNTISWHILFKVGDGEADNYWVTEWADETYPRADLPATHVVVYANGQQVANANVQYQDPDNEERYNVQWHELPGVKTVKVTAGETVTYHDTLQGAIDAAANGTVTLLADIHLTTMVTIAQDKNITLDLAGHKITGIGWSNEAEGKHIYAIVNNGRLTLKDTVGNGSVTARGAVDNYGTMIMESGTIYTCDTNGGYGVWNRGGASFTMNGGLIENTFLGNYNDPNERYNPSCLMVESGATALLTGGSFKSKSVRAYAITSDGVLTIEPAEGKEVTVYAPRGVAIDGGTAIIHGGSFTVYDSRFAGDKSDGGNGYVAADIYYPLYVSGGEATIYGGVFNAGAGGEGDLFKQGYCVNILGKVTVYDGTFNGPIGSNEEADRGQGTIQINGGKFLGWNPSCNNAEGDHTHKYVSEGKVGVLGQDGYYTLANGKHVAQTETQCFTTLEEAVAAAQADASKTVTVIDDVTVSESLDLSGLKFIIGTDPTDVTKNPTVKIPERVTVTTSAATTVEIYGTIVLDGTLNAAGLLYFTDATENKVGLKGQTCGEIVLGSTSTFVAPAVWDTLWGQKWQPNLGGMTGVNGIVKSCEVGAAIQTPSLGVYKCVTALNGDFNAANTYWSKVINATVGGDTATSGTIEDIIDKAADAATTATPVKIELSKPESGAVDSEVVTNAIQQIAGSEANINLSIPVTEKSKNETVTVTFDKAAITAINTQATGKEPIVLVVDNVTGTDGHVKGAQATYEITMKQGDTEVYPEHNTDNNGIATVVVPIPEGVENPVAFYVDGDNKELLKSEVVVIEGDQYLSFEISHFSTVAIEEAPAAKIGTAVYDTLAEALAAAKDQDVVELLKDVNAAGTTVMVPAGVTLHLGAHTLTAEYVVAFGTVTAATNSGKIVVDKDKVFLSGATYEKTNSSGKKYNILPIYNGTDGYLFTSVMVNTEPLEGFTPDTNRGLYVDTENKNLKYKFNVDMTTACKSLLMDGAADNAFEIIVRLTWKTATGDAKQDFVFNEEHIKAVFADGSTMDFYLNLTGYDQLGIDMDTSDLKVYAMVTTDSGAESQGKALTYADRNT